MRLFHAALAALALAAAAPADAHCYSRWYYPYPQHCGSALIAHRAAEDRSWYVEITAAPPDIPLPSLEPIPADEASDAETLARLKMRGMLNR
jgi:hypothetical protein